MSSMWEDIFELLVFKLWWKYVPVGLLVIPKDFDEGAEEVWAFLFWLASVCKSHQAQLKT